jgi:hypothetical protein
MSDLEYYLFISEMEKKINDNFNGWIKRNCIFGNGRDKKRIQLCTVDGKIVNDISHLEIK